MIFQSLLPGQDHIVKTRRNFTVIGDLAHSVGWKHKDLMSRLEEKRKVKSAAFWEKSKAAAALKRKAIKESDTAACDKVLAANGY